MERQTVTISVEVEVEFLADEDGVTVSSVTIEGHDAMCGKAFDILVNAAESHISPADWEAV